jgi:beta-glucosidase
MKNKFIVIILCILTGSVLDAQTALFDPDPSAWTAEKGTYTVRIGASSKEIKQTATFSLGSDIIVKKETPALQAKIRINELEPR